MRNHISAVLILSQLVGCSTYYKQSIESSPPPISPPKIITGQYATVWGGYNKYTVDIWEKTGLFKAVSYASSANIPLTGTFITTECSLLNDPHEETAVGMFLGLIALSSAGTLPILLQHEDYTCSTKFYQNGGLLGESSTTYTNHFVQSSWLFALFHHPQSQVIHNINTNAATAIVSNTLVALKRSYP